MPVANHVFRFSSLLVIPTCVLLISCSQEVQQPPVATADYQEVLMTQLIEAKAGDVIEIPAGTFHFNRGLTLNADDVTLRGQGMDQTILSFRDQIQGAEGLLVGASDFTIEDLAIEDAKGDGLKINDGKNIVIRRVRVEWTDGPQTGNGAYGIYPVQTENTLIEESVAIGASDAGIYVGQSRNVVVRNNRAEYNVAGIEVENTEHADVYGNTATNNTGGILVFNMPNLPVPGRGTRVYDNDIVANNTDNFAPEGTAVSNVRAGSGVVINSNDDIEIFDNRIADNDTANIIISSARSVFADRKMAEAFDPYPESIYIHDNQFSGGGTNPDSPELQGLLKQSGLDALPDVLWDGYFDPAKQVDGETPDHLKICLQNGDAGIINVDVPNGYESISTDRAPHDCRLEPLPPVKLSLAESHGA
jgi:parallel beta-helix repeat protein